MKLPETPVLGSPETPEPSIGRGAAVATLGTAASRLTGFLRLAALTYALGVTETRLADTYNIANTAPNVVYELVLGGVLSSVLLPVYIEARRRDGEEQAWQFIVGASNFALVTLTILVIAGMLAAPTIVRLYTLASDGPERQRQIELATFLLRLFLPQVILYGISSITTAVLNAHRRFGVPMIAPVLNNLIAVATFLTFAAWVPIAGRSLGSLPRSGALLLGLGTTLGVAAMALFPFAYLRRYAGRWNIRIPVRDARFRRLWRLGIFAAGYVVSNQIGLWLVLVLAGSLQGGVTAYQAAFVFFQLPHGLLAVSLATALQPRLSELAVANDMAAFRSRLSMGIRATAFVILPAAAGYIALAPQIVRFLLQHGVMQSQSTELVALVLRFFAVGLVGFSTFQLLLRSFYALQDTRTPMLINLAAVILNMALDVGLFTIMPSAELKIASLALGHGISYLFAVVVAITILRRRVGKLREKALVVAVFKMAVAACICGLAAAFASLGIAAAMPAGIIGEAAQVLGAVAAGLSVYIGCAALLRLEELRLIKSLVLAPSIRRR